MVRSADAGRSSSERILDAVRRVPAGKVVSYGKVARLAGLPGAARQVGYAMARLDGESDVPWQRVVRSDGSLAPRGGGLASCGMKEQRRLLEGEGVGFGADDRIDLARYGWRPEPPPE